MNTEMIFSMSDEVVLSSRVRRPFAICAATGTWQHATLATAAKYATKRNLSALEELRTE